MHLTVVFVTEYVVFFSLIGFCLSFNVQHIPCVGCNSVLNDSIILRIEE